MDSGNVRVRVKMHSHEILSCCLVFLVYALLCASAACALSETHPFIVYPAGSIDMIKARLSEDPYASWFEELVHEADAILQKEVSWDKTDVPKVTQGYYAKLLAYTYACTDTAAPDHDRYGSEAAQCLYHVPDSNFKSFFSSDLDVSEAALFWSETYDILKGSNFHFTLDDSLDMEPVIRGKLSALRDYMARDWNEDFFSPGIARDFISVAYYDAGHSDNHHVKLYSSLAVLALVIYDESGSDADYSRAVSRLPGILNTMTITGDYGEPAGGWAEGPNYYLYSARQLFPALIALKNKNIPDFPDIPELIQTRLWLPRIVMPDGYTPPVDDNEAVIFDLAGLMYSQDNDVPEKDMLLWMWELTGRRVIKEFLPEYISQFDTSLPVNNSPADMGWNPTDFFPESGFARFRNSWNTDAVYLLFLTEHGEARINGQAHEHPDPNTFILHAYGDMLLLDSGYGGWTEHDSTRYAQNHNLILVDGDGPEAASQGGLLNFWSANGADSYLTGFFSSPGIDYAMAKTTYHETDFSRSILFPRHRYFIVYDRVSSASSRMFTLLFHGNGGGTSGGSFALTDHGGRWEQEHAVLQTFTVGSTDLSCETEDMNHAVYNRTPMLSHTVLKVSQTGADERFLSVLYPERKGELLPDILSVDIADGRGIRVAHADTVDYVCMNLAGSPMNIPAEHGPYLTDGECACVSDTPEDHPLSFFFIRGTFVISAQDTLVRASRPVNLSIDYKRSQDIEGYIQTGQETEVILYSTPPSKVLYRDQEIPFSTCNHTVRFMVSGEGALKIQSEGMEYALEPPDNVVVSDNDHDNGYSIRISWSLSPSEKDGLVEWYRIYRSRTCWLTDPLPVTHFTSLDSLNVWEEYHTVLVDSVASGTSEYTDHSVSLNNVPYFYWLQAVGSGGESSKAAADVLTGVDEKPSGYLMKQPYPNPFNASTVLEYYLPENCRVSLVIYDILGREVAVLEDSYRHAGYHRALWDGKNESGQPSGSGLYFYRFHASSFTGQGKMLLLR